MTSTNEKPCGNYEQENGVSGNYAEASGLELKDITKYVTIFCK